MKNQKKRECNTRTSQEVTPPTAAPCSPTLSSSSSFSAAATWDPDRPCVMERTINSLTYKGSIPDAINQSRRQKKLFVVYISGEDEASSSLEQSTLVDENVVEVIGRCCIFLHLKQGNVDASQFSAIYPQKSVPSISVIGLNGVMLWNHEGHISSENMKESIEKAWAALHLQETAATLLTASLASRNAEPVNTTTTLLPQGGSATSEDPSVSSSAPYISGASGVAHSAELVSQLPSTTNHDELVEIDEKQGEGSKSDPGGIAVEKIDSACTEVGCDLPISSRSVSMGSSANPEDEDSTPSLKRKNKDDGTCAAVPVVATPSTSSSRGVSTQLLVQQDSVTSSAPDEPVSSSVKSDDIQLSIRMPSGNRLEMKLTKQDVLRKVKNFVDENKGSGLGSYDLSLVYPKRIFSDQDMETTLYELGIQNRHAMIVVPHRQPVQVSRLQSSSSYAGDSSGGGGYFGYLRTIMSYANPLSYLRGNPTTSRPELEPNEGRPSGPWSERRPLPGNRGQEADR
ncbi:plant UBX domain-containing protein 11-like isoform X1 [Panicum virgatum]|nr:plant UBX domain-containing protein 11-like isoform X1 [Panicum virgatum]